MPGLYDSASSLPSPDPDNTETAPHTREIIIRIYASDEKGRFFATAPVPPPTPPDTTASSGSDQDKQEKQKKAPPLRRKLSKPARLRGNAESPRGATGSINRSISNPVKRVHHSKSAETFRQEREVRQTPHRASQPPQRLQRQDSRSQQILKTGSQRPNYGQEAKYDLDVCSGDEDAPVFGSCDKRMRRNRSYESNIIPPSSKRDRSKTPNRHAVDGIESSTSPAVETPPMPAKNVHGQTQGVPEFLSSLSLEQFRKDIGWPSAVDCTNSDELLPAMRYSGKSPISTMESIVVDDLAQSEKRDLRHTDRQSSLRFASSPTTNSDRASLTWGLDSPHRLLHKAGRISEKDRRNIAPEVDMFAEQTSQAPKRRVDVVPVVVIPERQSSLSYPATQAAAGNNPSRSSQQSNERPSTAAGDWARSSDAPQQRERSKPVADFSQGIASRSQSARRPAVPPRRSSLSAPTTANNSRAASLTSDSLRSHTLAMRQNEFKKHLEEKPMPDLPSEAVRPSMYGLTDDDTQTQSILIGIEDVDNIGTPSAPFSHGSLPSSPGAFEVNEATAVNLYPHNNESLLLVDRQTRNRNKKQEAQGGKSQTRQVVEFATNDGGSPRHPRPPPNTPICHVTPPSPMRELEPASNSKTQEPVLRRFGSLRRAWSTRTRAEPANIPKRSFSTSATDNRKDTTNRVPENRLHPFWRPRRVQNDFPQPPKQRAADSPMHPPTSHTKQNDNIVKNSLGMPQPRAVIDGPSLPVRTRSRRETNQRQRPQPPRKARPTTIYNSGLNRSTIALGNSTTDRVLNGPEFIDRTSRASRHLRQCQQHPVSWGYKIRLGMVRNLRRRFRGRMQQHEEGKYEARREKLKRNIGGTVQVDAAHGNGRRRRGRLTKRR